MYAELTQKLCTKCETVKPIEEFYKNARYADGYVTWCRTCKQAHARQNPQIHKRWAGKNPELVKAAKSKYVAENPDKVKKAKAKWSKANNKKVLAKTRKYQAAKLGATPKWLTKEQIKEMENMYLNCPPGYEVDHIMPLQGKNSCGLHVPWNLQYLPMRENRKKSNKC